MVHLLLEEKMDKVKVRAEVLLAFQRLFEACVNSDEEAPPASEPSHSIEPFTGHDLFYHNGGIDEDVQVKDQATRGVSGSHD